MKHIIISFIVILTFSCNPKENQGTHTDSLIAKIQTPKIYIKKFITIGDGDNQKQKIDTSSINSDYFEVDLNSFGNINPSNSEPGFRAEKEMETPKVGQPFKLVFFHITDEKGEVMEFKSSMDFLNFMSERGYEMVDQNKTKYKTAYTFKKKTK